jgi:L-fucose isomerase-like protein
MPRAASRCGADGANVPDFPNPPFDQVYNKLMRPRLGFVSVLRPLFKGDSQGVAARSEVGLRHLGEELGFELATSAQVVTDAESAGQAASELASLELDFLLVQHTTFATGDLLAPLVKAAKRVGVWAVPEAAGLAPGVMSGPLPLNSLCGLNMTLSLLDHPAVAKQGPVKWFYGELKSESFRSRLEPTLAALRGLKSLEGARILQLGGTAPGFYGIEEEPALAAVTVDHLDLAAAFERVAAVPEREAKARAADWLELEPRLSAPREHLEGAARVELALKTIALEGGYHALALRCWPEFPERCGAMACASVAKLGDAELPTACEGDVMGALSMLVLQGMSERPAMLMDLSDLDEADDSLLFWHCGNAPLSWAAPGGTRLTTHFNRDNLGVVRDMVLRPGPATGFRLLQGGSRAAIISGRFGEPSKPSFDGVRGWLRELSWNGGRLSAKGFVANVLDRRLPHHLAFGEGELTSGLQELCAWLGATPVEAAPARSSP